ncbi:hypothetical protein [Mesorhizobium sp.]|uniref:hypothetical protein n=1 Tax=Mesorhizobium sp. TaxID=1871066 RepID=UPI000FD584A9|nr:hypothetical protein [Mesorhizobium sp.]RUU48728.1 hypothetical protein EOD08_01300 [Mesorhizobium sp. M6A.T.Ca.TU.002.02.2.1]RWP45636.1 MAG: hypothetical protein EOR06_30885 [Mesorhizobium sp.]RWP67710.1 MAG: hypothetical protein EOR09_32235 [Mesorhizobium sp.]
MLSEPSKCRAIDDDLHPFAEHKMLPVEVSAQIFKRQNGLFFFVGLHHSYRHTSIVDRLARPNNNPLLLIDGPK